MFNRITRFFLLAFCLFHLSGGAYRLAGSAGDRMEGSVGSAANATDSDKRVRVATTTSLYDTGLWDALEPIFEKTCGMELDVIYAGTGIALEYGRRGDVDVITVHSKKREEEFISQGFGEKRVPFAYNYFIIVGPRGDPAGLKGKTPEDAFTKLYESREALFISRGDDSGTHSKEKQIWENAGFRDIEAVSESGDWYIEAGRGMGPTLLMASDMGAYTLCDRGTFLSYRGRLDLVPIVERGGSLLNVYSCIICSPERKGDHVPMKARKLVDFLTSPEIQTFIGSYGMDTFGVPLFTPCAGAEPIK